MLDRQSPLTPSLGTPLALQFITPQGLQQNGQPGDTSVIELHSTPNDNPVEKLRGEVAELKEQLRLAVKEIYGIGESIKKIEVKIDKEILARMDTQEDQLRKMSQKMESDRKRVEEIKRGMNVIEAKVAALEARDTVAENNENYRKLEKKLEELKAREIDQEARSRRNNLIFHGIQETPGEDCSKVLHGFLRNVCNFAKPGADFLIQRCHRLGKPRTGLIGQRANKPRPIIANFLDFREKEEIRRTRTSLPIQFSITEDLPIEIRKAREQLLPELKECKQQGKKATIIYPAKLLVDGKIQREVLPTSTD